MINIWWDDKQEFRKQYYDLYSRMYFNVLGQHTLQNSDKLECGPMPNVMATLEYRCRPLLKMTRSESSVIPFLVPRHKVRLMPTARVPCSKAANIGEGKNWTQNDFCTWQNSVRGAKAPKKVYIVYQPRKRPNIVQSFKVWLTSAEQHWCNNKSRCETCWNLLRCPKLSNRGFYACRLWGERWEETGRGGSRPRLGTCWSVTDYEQVRWYMRPIVLQQSTSLCYHFVITSAGDIVHHSAAIRSY